MAGVVEFIEKLKERNGYGKELFEGCSTIEEMLAKASEAGYSLSGDELKQAIADARGPKIMQLDDRDLEQVAGGRSPDEFEWCTCYGA
jgi:predicted ribosomally synthesized peptide with nif11-like leader